MLFFLGFLSGIVFCVLAAIVQFRYEPKIERTIERVRSVTREKGEILEDPKEKAEILSSMFNEDDV